jgi:hypothetical protein
MNPDEFIVKSDQLSLLGALFPGERSLISPLLPNVEPPQREQAKRDLLSSGILDRNGEIDERHHATLAALALAGRRVTIALFFPNRQVTVDRLFAQKDGTTVTLFERDEGMTAIGKDVDTDEILDSIDFSDDEKSVHVPSFAVALNQNDFILFSAILDGERASVIAALKTTGADDTPIPPVIHTPGTVEKTLSAYQPASGEYPWLRIASDITGRTDLQNPENPGSRMQGLAAQGLLVPAPDGYQLTEAVASMVKRLVLTDLILNVSIRKGTKEKEEPEDEGYCIRGDGTLLWIVARSDRPGTVSIQYMGAGILVDMVKNLLVDPDYSFVPVTTAQVPATGASVQQSAAPSPKKFCSQCGAPVKAGLKFCSSCGTKIA